MKKNIIYALFSLLACLSSYYNANGHAGIGVVVKDGCDRYLAIGTWHSSVSQLNNTINTTKGIYIDVNGDGNFTNCCSGTSSSEFFCFTDYTFPNNPANWSSITNGSQTITNLVNYFNNSSIYNSTNLSNRFTAEIVWAPNCSSGALYSWVILKLPAILNPGTIYDCRTSSTSVVEKPCSSPIFQITFGSDINIIGDGTVLCESDSLNLTSSGADDLEWFRNGVLIQGPSNDSTITVSQIGNYTVRKGGTGCQSRTSEIYEIVMNPKVNLGVDTSICIGDSVLLDGGVGVSYLWSTSQISRFIYNFGDSVSVTRTDSDGCTDSDSIIVSFHAQPNAQFTIDDSLQCFRNHEIVAINKSTLAQGAVQSRTWTTESTDYLNIDTLNQVYSSANDYTIQLTIESDQGCFDSLTKTVTIYPRPLATFLLDTSEQSCFEFQFINTSIGDKIQPFWTIKNADLSSTFYIEDNPKHRLDKLVDSVFACLKVSDKNGCSDSVCLAFPNKFKESLDLYNVFTPDDDGYNDNYLVDIVGASEFLLYIYNRFGDQMFFTEDPKNGWNGKFQNSGISLPEGTYFYIVEYRMLCTEKQERISGIIELIR